MDPKAMAGLVTGAGGGIGRQTALLLARRGHDVAVLDRTEATVNETARLVEAEGRRAFPFVVDVTAEREVAKAVAEAERLSGGISYVASLAGFYRSEPFDEMSAESWHEVFAVNCHGGFNLCKAVLPAMSARRFGAIVLMSSLHAVNGMARAAAYASAKAAMIGLTKSLAREKGPLGIRVNAVAPGPIDTNLWRGALPPDEVDAAIEARSKAIPLGRLGRPEEVAGTIVYLLGPDAGYVTGQILSVGGGEV